VTAESWILPEELRQLAESGEAGLVEEVLGVFLHDTEERIGAMKAAAAAMDRENLRRQGHALKGSSAQVGALGLAGLCKSLEGTAMTATPAEITAIVAEIEREFEAVRKKISEKTK
jgi:HPt (histidine-containing phosphotransfer) domain-containing protein